MARILEVQKTYNGPQTITAEPVSQKELNMLGYRTYPKPKRYRSPLDNIKPMSFNSPFQSR